MRRKPFRRRPPRGAFRRRGDTLPPAIRDAHFLALNGQPDRAAQSMEDLARQAAERGGPNAAQMFMQAGRYYAQAGRYDQARPAIETGLKLLAKNIAVPRLARVIDRLALTLERQGHSQLSREVILLGQDLLPAGRRASEIKIPEPAESGLPAKCPYCGATVDPRDIEWLEDRSAMCEYCGSVLEA